MKFALTILAIVLNVEIATEAFAEILPKNVLTIKEEFEKVGATRCATAMAKTINFIAKGGPVTNLRQWSTNDTNSKSISLDFLVSGTKGDFSKTGNITFTPINGQCTGAYVYTWVSPAANCKAYIQQHGFDDDDWSEDLSDENGDGGKVYFLSPKKNASLNLIFNDVAGGCSVTKREMLTMDGTNKKN